MKQLTSLRFLLVLLSLVLLLTGCGGPGRSAEVMVQPVRFYYRTAVTDFSGEDGVIRPEVRDLGAGTYTNAELFALYFQGPVTPELVSPFTQDTVLEDVRRIGGTLEILLTREANSPAAFDHALTYACLAKTGLGLEGIRKVRIRVSSRGGALLSDMSLTESDILLFDQGTAPETTELTLYYADEAGVLLLSEKRTVPYVRSQDLPQVVMEQLLTPPQSGGMRSPLPPGTAVLDLSLESGICTVDFNGDFLSNRPETEQEEALVVLSVVNSLCELDVVNQVQLLVEGRRLDRYSWLDLSHPFWMDSSVVGPVREELSEFTAQLCLPSLRESPLHRLTLRCRARGGVSRVEALLQALLDRSLENGLFNPFAGCSPALSVSVSGRLCRVNLAPGTLPVQSQERLLALRALTATLCSLPEIAALEVSEGGIVITDEPLSPEPEWFAVPE